MGRQEDLDAAYAEVERRKNPEARAVALLRELAPYINSIVCYASTIEEHLPNRIVRDVEALLAGKTAEPYTVAGSGGERVLVTWEDIKAIMDRKLHVGQIGSRQGDGSRPYAVFSKRECAAEIAEMVNRRFNSTMGET